MATLSFILGFLAHRTRAQWPLTVALLLGCLVVIAAMAGAILYPDAVDQVGLQHTLAQRKPEDLHVQVSAYYFPPQRDAYQRTSSLIESALRRNAPWFYPGASRSGVASTFYVDPGGAAVPQASQEDRPRATVGYFQEMARHLKVVQGEMPRAAPQGGARRGEAAMRPAEVEALALRESAERFGLAPGAQVVLLPTWGTKEPPLHARVTGIADRQDPRDPFWTGAAAASLLQPQVRYPHLALVVSEASFFDVLGQSYPDMNADFWWFLAVDRAQVRPTNALRIRDGLEALNREMSVRVRRSRVITSLDSALKEYSTKREFARVPLALFTALVVGAGLYYLALAAGVLLERQAPELALLRSRGAGTLQLLGLLSAQAAVVVIPAALLGPPLALGLLLPFGVIGPLAAQTAGRALPVALSSPALTAAAVGAALAFLVVAIPGLRAARRTAPVQRIAQARPVARFVHHVSLDLLLGALALVLWLDLSQRGSFLAQRLFGQGPLADALLLLAPALALAAVLLLALRLLPVLLAALAALAERLPSPALLLALRHLAREPLLAAGPLALLAIAAALAVFAASFGATLERSYRERAAYQAGADLRITGLRPRWIGASRPFLEGVLPLDGAEAVSLARRDRGAVLSAGLGASFSILAVQPEGFADVARYRADFSPASLRDLLPPLAAGPVVQGRALPRLAGRLGLWARPVAARADLTLNVRVADAHGHVFSLPLGALGFREWRFLETDLAPRPPEGQRRPALTPTPPLSVQAIYVAATRQPGLAEPGALFLDGLRATTAGGGDVLVEGFDDVAPWQTFDNPSIPQRDSFVRAESVVREGAAAGLLTWGSGSPVYPRGIYLGLEEPSLPVVASESFLRGTGLRVGDEAILAISDVPLRARIVGQAAFFPTLYPTEDPFLVAGLAPLMERMNLKTAGQEVQPDELWIRTGDPARVRAALQALRQDGRLGFSEVVDRERLVTSYRVDPLIAAGWAGMLAIAFGAVLIVSVTGFVIYAAATVERRRTLFGVLRAVGLSPGQVRAIVWVDYGAVALLGLGVGTALGLGLGEFFLRFLEVTERGERVVPPFVLQVDWAALGGTYAILAFAVAIAAGAASARFVRQALGRALRWTEG